MRQPSSSNDPRTRFLRAGREPDPATGALTTPIIQSTTFAQSTVAGDAPYTYSRAANPTVAALETALAAVEGPDDARVTAYRSGMAAITTLFLATLRAGDHVVCAEVVYGGTTRILRRILANFGVEATFIDAADPDNVRRACTDRTRLIFVETPGNPTLDLVDIEAVARIAHDLGALLAVDNTFLTPLLQRPLERGADVAVVSTTKYIDGHNAAIGGSLATTDPQLDERFRLVRLCTGAIQAPFDAWLTLQGLKTLPLRLRAQCDAATRIAHELANDPRLRRVIHPSLPDFPQHDLAQRQQDAPGAIVCFELPGDVSRARRFVEALRLCIPAENLGAIETLITHPASMTHGDVPETQRRAAGITDGLLRLSVGLESPDDILADIDQALDASARKEVAA